MTRSGTASASFEAIGTTALVSVTDASALPQARALLERQLDELDRACSRFRCDSELARVNAANGAAVRVGPLMLQAVEEALRVARVTDGDVDPTVGASMRAIGYDRDFADVRSSAGRVRVVRNAGWRRVLLDRRASTIALPAGMELDLGASAKALAADRAARAIADAGDTGVLVGLGGDIAVAGDTPAGGWRVRITDDHRAPPDAPGETVAVCSGGLATSSVTTRSWTRDGRSLHHIVDPRTGLPAAILWRTVSVAAGSCVDANAASTAAIVRGEAAVEWLETLGLPSRLVRADGRVAYVAGWEPPAGRVGA